MTTAIEVDVIDKVLGLQPGSPLCELRAQRPKLKHLTQTSYVAALHPADPRSFSYAERAAVAARMAGLWSSSELVAHYKALAEAEGGVGDGIAMAEPGWTPADRTSRMAAVLRHVDLVTLTPKQATRANIEALAAAGLDDRDIVTLAGLIAFVNYQVLVVAGLKMLRDN
ncbi:CMD domain protein (plasmid) [Rhizobium sp. 32-5/1]|uniref:CMD domain protein n=1 Tax=Rhizobium sp. 32-5/1 TaxID=3019602 RepID=UPI00240E900C|nr:CMD domain protein [Rhizobium sp. 32-5/1]WEZ85787.1 CMD domain protein [Rhizobium sp. 32-5/1]